MLTEIEKLSHPTAQLGFLEILHKIRPDLSIEAISAMIIDEPAYYREHKDVHNAGVSAARHYYKFGETENRKFTYPRLGFSRRATQNIVTEGKVVFYTSATEDNPSWQYRCIFPYKKEELLYRHIFYSGTNLLSKVLLGIFSAKKVVFLRPTYSTRTIYLIQLCRRLGIEVQFDYDDLLLPEFARQRGACRSGLRGYKEDFSETLQQASLLSQADTLTCSTVGIATELEKINKNVTVVMNKLPLYMFKSANEVVENISQKRKKLPTNKLRILYLSGSNTHKRDFSTIMGPLVRLAQELPEKFALTFMGSLSDYSKLFATLGVESSIKPQVQFHEMLEVIHQHDLVLVPLENSHFNHCKSNIKYIESASQGVPVIASSVTEFSSSIQDGVNGWLCNGEQQWYEKLKNLITNPSLVYPCGANAYTHAKQEFSV